MERRELQRKILNLVKKIKSFSDVTETEFHDVEFKVGSMPYGIFIPKDRKDAVKLYRIERGDFLNDKEMLETYQQINIINGDSGNVHVYLNDISGVIIFNFQLRTDGRNHFLKSLLKGIYEIKHKVEFFQGGYIDELVEEPPCISCRYHTLENNRTMSKCELGKSPSFYLVKSNECAHQRGWSDNE